MKLVKNSQNVRLLVEMVRGREISRLPALTRLKVQNFQARVSDLKSNYCIEKYTRMTKHGRKYTAYAMACEICKSNAGSDLNATKRQTRRRAVQV